MNDEFDNTDDSGFDEYNDQDATDCANGDYNVHEENELAKDNEGEMEDRMLDMMMEDRIGGTGCLENEEG